MIKSYIGICILITTFWMSMYGCTWRDVPTPLGPVDIVIDASTIIGVYNAVYGGDNHYPNASQKKVMHVPVKSISKNINPIMNDGNPTVGVIPDSKMGSIKEMPGAWMSESDFKKLYKMSLNCKKPCIFLTETGNRVKIEQSEVEDKKSEVEDSKKETSNYI